MKTEGFISEYDHNTLRYIYNTTYGATWNLCRDPAPDGEVLDLILFVDTVLGSFTHLVFLWLTFAHTPVRIRSP